MDDVKMNGDVEAIADALVDRPEVPAVPDIPIGQLEPIPVAGEFDWPAEELKVLKMWKENDTFQESVRQSQGRPAFSFYDGPPFATGLPHYGHLLMGTVKDIVTRFAHSNGYYVERRFGWDCHGLPVEHEIDKKLGITSKDDVMKMGIDKYNAECRAIVMRYSSEWRATVERMGRWIDFDNDYKTLNTPFMESVWWVFKQLWEKKLVYRGLRVMPYSTGCTTPLSNFEATSAYKDVPDPAVTIAFELLDEPGVSLLAWTTTPWTLPSNLALCVHPDLTYLKIVDEKTGRTFYICDKLLSTLYPRQKAPKYKKLASVLGKDMAGWRYKPLFPYFVERYGDRAFKVLNDKYVTADSGTGIVHQAPAFGEDDHRISIANGIIRNDEMPPCPVDEAGIFTAEVTDFAGQYVKAADKAIMKHLDTTGNLIRQDSIMHSYPFCWRSGTPLIYKAIPAWFVKVQDKVDELIENNRVTRWVPQSVGDNRFGSWLANARDWNVSRNRYWGTPLPVWVSDDYEEMICVGSIEELQRLSGRSDITDLHRDKIDDIKIQSQQGKGTLRRVEEVFDCWFESGSMPYAQVHYPFENKAKFEASFPADFISEAIDQTRGWFYTLLVLATHLFESAPWKNLIVCGLVLAEDGQKMSKSKKNYPDPNGVMSKFGADALRLFLIDSPVVRGDNLKFREDGVKEVTYRVLAPWLNSFRFMLQQVALLKKQKNIDFKYNHDAPLSRNVMDRWILARCQTLIKLIKTEMEAYRLFAVVKPLLNLIDELTNWYIRFNRKRLKGESGVDETISALQSLFEALLTLCRTMTSFTPFLAENIYQSLRPFLPAKTDGLGLGNDLRSVHFLPFPVAREEYHDVVIERQVQRMQAVINLGRVLRDKYTLRLKIPLRELVIFHPDQQYLDDVMSLKQYIQEELNIKDLRTSSDENACGVKWKVDADWSVLGKKLRKDLPRLKKGLPTVTSEQVKAYLSDGKITIDGINLVAGDLTTQRYVEFANPKYSNEEKKVPNPATDTDDDVVILLDTEIVPDFILESYARDIVNRVQKARKAAGCQATDDMEVYLAYSDEEAREQLSTVLAEKSHVITKVLADAPVDDASRDKQRPVYWQDEEEQEVGGSKFKIVLLEAGKQ